jgi:phage terminase small subunit
MTKTISIEGKKYGIPGHLNAATRKWFRQVLEEYALEPHHVKLLTLAAEAWDRSVEAEKAIRKFGVLFKDPHTDRPKVNPAIKVKEQGEIIFARLLRELNLDIEPPKGPGRPPGLY